MEVLTTTEMERADRLTIAAGTPGFALMMSAGQAVAEAAMDLVEEGPIVVVAGRGNNGGDGFVAAAELAARGREVSVILLCERDSLQGDAALAARGWKYPVLPFNPQAIGKPALIIDALFGAGLNRAVKGDPLEMIEAVNANGAPVLAVDLPSGVNGTSGAVMGAAINAVETVTFFRRKPAHLLMPGRKHCGRVRLADIGIDANVLEEIRPQDFQAILKQVEGKPEEKLVSYLLLRTMRLARYHEENLGHFGLATDMYAHFTSPIRRYPDLVVHRSLRALRHGRGDQAERDMSAPLPEMGLHLSEMERRATDAERELVEWKKVRFMADKLGEVFSGYVTGVQAFGLFVELDEIYVQGLVHVSSMTDDYYRFDEKAHLLKGENTGNVYRLGDRVKVQVAAVKLEERKIDFALVDVLERAAAGKGPGRPPARPGRPSRPASRGRERGRSRGGDGPPARRAAAGRGRGRRRR